MHFCTSSNKALGSVTLPWSQAVLSYFSFITSCSNLTFSRQRAPSSPPAIRGPAWVSLCRVVGRFEVLAFYFFTKLGRYFLTYKVRQSADTGSWDCFADPSVYSVCKWSVFGCILLINNSLICILDNKRVWASVCFSSSPNWNHLFAIICQKSAWPALLADRHSPVRGTSFQDGREYRLPAGPASPRDRT